MPQPAAILSTSCRPTSDCVSHLPHCHSGSSCHQLWARLVQEPPTGSAACSPGPGVSHDSQKCAVKTQVRSCPPCSLAFQGLKSAHCSLLVPRSWRLGGCLSSCPHRVPPGSTGFHRPGILAAHQPLLAPGQHRQPRLQVPPPPPPTRPSPPPPPRELGHTSLPAAALRTQLRCHFQRGLSWPSHPSWLTLPLAAFLFGLSLAHRTRWHRHLLACL